MPDFIFLEFPLKKIEEAQKKQDDALLKKIIKDESTVPFEWEEIDRIEAWGDMIQATVCFRLYYKKVDV